MESIVFFDLDTHHFICHASKKEDSFDIMSFHLKQTRRMYYFIIPSIIHYFIVHRGSFLWVSQLYSCRLINKQMLDKICM